MVKTEAIAVLVLYKRYILKNVYDTVPEIATAIFTLCHNFEYPDFSHKRISELLKSLNLNGE
jgi:hypothetical protein